LSAVADGVGIARDGRHRGVPDDLRPQNHSIVRFSFSTGAGSAPAELLGVVGLEEADQEAVGELASVADDLPAVVDRFGNPLQGDGPGLFLETQGVDPLNGGEGLPVGFGGAVGVVMEFTGDSRFGGGDPDDAVRLVGGEEGLLFCGEGLGHGAGPRSDSAPSARRRCCPTGPRKNGSIVRLAIPRARPAGQTGGWLPPHRSAHRKGTGVRPATATRGGRRRLGREAAPGGLRAGAGCPRLSTDIEAAPGAPSGSEQQGRTKRWPCPPGPTADRTISHAGAPGIRRVWSSKARSGRPGATLEADRTPG